MTKRLITSLAAASVAAAVSSLAPLGASAGPLKHHATARGTGQEQLAGLLPAYEIAAGVRAVGLDPVSAPVLRGPYYVLHAVNPYGVELRVLADAQFGDILSMTPALPLGIIPAPYSSGPRIIHIPQPDDAKAGGDKRTKANDVPPARTDKALIPVYPTPAFGPKADNAGKAASPTGPDELAAKPIPPASETSPAARQN